MKLDFEHLKFIFIDFDGTLVDSVPILLDNYLKFLKKFEKKGNQEEFLSLMGPTIAEFVPVLKQRYELPGSVEELLQMYTHGLAQRYEKEAFLIPGAKNFLEFVHSLGILMVLVTSSPYTLIERCLENLRLNQYFEHIVTGEKVMKTKPDPEIYFLALKSCAAKPEQTVTIEDSYNGILSALGAHIPTLAIKNPHLKNIPDGAIAVNNWKELIQDFKQAYAK